MDLYPTAIKVSTGLSSYWVQQVVAILVCPVSGLVLVGMLRVWPQELQANVVVQSLWPLTMLGAGLVAGYYIPKFWLKGYSRAKWTWLLPTTLWAAAFLRECKVSGFRPTLEAFTGIPNDPLNHSEGLGILFFSLPLISSYLYSLGAFCRAKFNPNVSEG